MARTPPWKWLVTRFTSRNSATPTRPCLLAVEQLDDRILPSATSTPPAVTAFLKYEGNFLAREDAILTAESAVITQFQQAGYQLPSSVATIWIKIDNDFIKLDADLAGQAAAGSTGTTGAVGGIDGTLLRIYNRQSAADEGVAAQADATRAAALVKTLLSGTGKPPTPDAFVNAYLKIDAVDKDSVAAANDFARNVRAVAGGFLKLNPADLEGALASLQTDLATLAADATLPPAPPAVKAFLKFESEFLKFESAFIKQEVDYIKGAGSQLSAGEAAYFLKIDSDLLAIDNDIAAVGDALLGIGSQGSENGTLRTKYRRVLLQQGRLLQADGSAEAEVLAAEALLPKSASGAAAAAGQFLKIDFIKDRGEAAHLLVNFTKIEFNFIATDANDLTKPVTTLGSDLNTLLADLKGPGTGSGATGA